MAYVLPPQAFLNVELHQDVRKLLLETARLEWAEFLDDAFDGVFAPALLLRAVKGKARPEHKMTVVSGRGVHRIGQARFAQNDLTQFNLGCTDGGTGHPGEDEKGAGSHVFAGAAQSSR